MVVPMPGIAFRARGDWGPEAVSVDWVASTFAPPPAVQTLIERTWAEMAAKPGVRLFDGPLCRLEGFAADSGRLALRLSRTSYKPFIGTNGRNAAAAAAHGAHALADGVGTSAAVVSEDGWLLFGVRSASLALYPGCAHPIGGCLEPAERLDVFADMARELREELRIADADIVSLRLVALGTDLDLRQPELTWVARLALPRAELERRIDPEEHHASWCVRADRAGVEAALADDRTMTPLTRLTLLAYGAHAFGDDWFAPRAP